MGENSKIEWTDHTFNPWIGCTKVSPACAHCYAETLADTRYGWAKWGKGNPRKRTSEANWRKPIQWNKASEKAGTHSRVFCASLADVFDDAVPIEWLADLFVLICSTKNLNWLLLTKRPENLKDRLSAASEFINNRRSPGLPECEAWITTGLLGEGGRDDLIPPWNIWLGITAESQEWAEKRIPLMLEIPAGVHFVSYEPALGPIDFSQWLNPRGDAEKRGHTLDWIIAGGESGPGARPTQAEWFLDVRDQCANSCTPFLFKQWGEHDAKGQRVGKKAAGRLLNGCEYNGIPQLQEAA